MSITLPNEMAELVRDKVARGDYASDSEVRRDALRVLGERDRAVEAWLREQVVALCKRSATMPGERCPPIKYARISRNPGLAADEMEVQLPQTHRPDEGTRKRDRTGLVPRSGYQ
jgi:putative addiction module CopG family antidote